MGGGNEAWGQPGKMAVMLLAPMVQRRLEMTMIPQCCRQSNRHRHGPEPSALGHCDVTAPFGALDAELALA